MVYISFKLVYILIFKYSDRTHACGEGIIGVGVVRKQGLRRCGTIRGRKQKGAREKGRTISRRKTKKICIFE